MADAAAIARLRARAGDTGATPAFSDGELNTILDAAGGDELMALREVLVQLHAEAVKQVDYSDGNCREQSSQWAANLAERIDRADREIALRARGGQMGTTFAATQPVW